MNTDQTPNTNKISFQINGNYYEAMIFRVRMTVLGLVCFLNLSALLFIPNYSAKLMIFTLFGQIIHFYILISLKSSYILGLSFHVITFIRLVFQILHSQDLFFNWTTSLAGFILCSLQFYPIVLDLLFGAINFGVLAYQHSFLLGSLPLSENLYFQNTSETWIGTIIVAFLSINLYQIYNNNIWRDYDRTNKELIEKNREPEQANLKMEDRLTNLKKTNQKLEMANRSFAEALKSQDLFVACVSHELRNPLNAMLGNIEVLQSEQMDTNKKKMLKTCQIDGDMLLVLINNILDVAKINSAKLEINMGVINMQNFVEKIWGVSRVRILQKNLYGKLIISKDVPLWLKGDFHRLIQVILNLVGNATKFTTEGGVKVIISWEEPSTKDIEEDIFYTPRAETANQKLIFGSQAEIFDEFQDKRGINEVLLTKICPPPMFRLNLKS